MTSILDREARRRVRRILVVRRKALGDALVTMPAVLELAAAFPEASLDLVVDRPYAELMAGLDSRLRIISWPPDGGGGWAWLRGLRRARYDLVVDFLGSPRTAVWTALSGAPLRVGYDLRLRSWAYNLRVPRNRRGDVRLRQVAGESFLDPRRRLALNPSPWRPVAGGAAGEGRLGDSYRAWRSEWSAPRGARVGLALSATWPAKAWPAARAAELVGLLDAAGLSPLIVPGPGDEAIVAAVKALAPRVEVAPPTDLLELADLLAGLDALVATDCGARHMAVAVGTSTATLFGPTDPVGWNPEDPRHVALRTGVSCSPCDLTECPVAGHPCLDELSAAAVAAAVRELLTRRPGRTRDIL